MLKTIILVRGLPGSGKSTYARKMGIAHYEADMFFMSSGKYLFDPSQLSQAHGWCQDMVRNTVMLGHDIVVSNTFVKRWEMKAYFDLAIDYGYIVKEVTMTGTYDSIHGVSAAVIDRMRINWEA